MDCGQLPLSSYSVLVSRICSSESGANLPLFGSFELTSRCNLKCIHCYINKNVNDCGIQKDELSTAEIFHLLDQLADAGCLSLLFTGGECLVREDFLDIYTYAKKKGILTSLYTNATLINDTIADHLSKYRPKIIEVTIYGATAKTYEKVTGVPGSFERCMRGIELLIEKGINLELKTMAIKANLHELEKMKEFAREKGLRFRYDPVLSMRIDQGDRPGKQRISPVQIIDFEHLDERKVKEWKRLGNNFSTVPSKPEYLYQCGAGRSFFHIDASGKMSACMVAREPSFDLRQGNFRTGWENFIPEVLSQQWCKSSPCKECKINVFCGQCPGMSQMEHGDQEALVEYLCEIGHRRAKAFGFANCGPFSKKYL